MAPPRPPWRSTTAPQQRTGMSPRALRALRGVHPRTWPCLLLQSLHTCGSSSSSCSSSGGSCPLHPSPRRESSRPMPASRGPWARTQAPAGAGRFAARVRTVGARASPAGGRKVAPHSPANSRAEVCLWTSSAPRPASAARAPRPRSAPWARTSRIAPRPGRCLRSPRARARRAPGSGACRRSRGGRCQTWAPQRPCDKRGPCLRPCATSTAT
mmetsp:Transcript_109209/g.315559  ORF Transcript_109209/g.315559 Transcript_109209/m.315559 type:complete len:213 (+) Transcript_109209:138-776(+)